jgi:hypothetical protein
MSNMVPSRDLSGHISDLTSKKMFPGGKKAAQHYQHVQDRFEQPPLKTCPVMSRNRRLVMVAFRGFSALAS